MNKIKSYVRGAYDIQKLRIQMGLRIVSNFKAKLGQESGAPEEDLSLDAKKILAQLRTDYDRLTDGIASLPMGKKFKGGEIISTQTELCLMSQYFDLEKSEKNHFKYLEKILSEYPIYTQFLKGVKGVGAAMAGVIISEIDIKKCKYPSSLWMYAGLDVAADGKGRSRKSEHLVPKTYTNAEGEIKETVGITFNPFLKTKLVGVLGGSFLKSKSPYADIYNNYKNRLENHEAHKEKTKGHRHNMAIRYMVKIFLCDLYVAWRNVEGLPVSATYQEGKLKHKHDAA